MMGMVMNKALDQYLPPYKHEQSQLFFFFFLFTIEDNPLGQELVLAVQSFYRDSALCVCVWMRACVRTRVRKRGDVVGTRVAVLAITNDW